MIIVFGFSVWTAPLAVAGCPELFTWSAYQTEFNRLSSLNFQQRLYFYRDPKFQNSGHLTEMRSVGFRFSSVNPRSPAIENFFEQYQNEMDTWVNAGVIGKEDILWPARVFYSSLGELVGIRQGEEAPHGFAPFLKRIPTNAFARLMSQGLFPLGDPRDLLSHFHFFSTAEHDVFEHFKSFMRYPRYMAQLKKAYTDFHRNGVNLGVVNRADESRGYSAVSDRMYMALELIATVNPDFVEVLRSHLDLPRVNEPILRVSTVRSHLAVRDPDEIKRLINDLVQLYPQIAVRAGASSHGFDSSHRTHYYQGHLSYGGTLEEIWQSLAHPETHGLNSFEAQVNQLARFEVFLVQSSRITPEEWVKQAALTDEQYLKSTLYEVLCQSEVLTSENYYFRSHCQIVVSRP